MRATTQIIRQQAFVSIFSQIERRKYESFTNKFSHKQTNFLLEALVYYIVPGAYESYFVIVSIPSYIDQWSCSEKNLYFVPLLGCFLYLVEFSTT